MITSALGTAPICGAVVAAIGTSVVLVQEHELSKYVDVVHGIPLTIVTASLAGVGKDPTGKIEVLVQEHEES